MSGKRLLDAIQFFNVAKSVAAKHLAVRQRQLDVYTRTSSLTKGIKSQTDGLILTAQAAASLARRFTEPGQQPSTAAEKQSAGTAHDQRATVRSSSSGGIQGSHAPSEVNKATGQDHLQNQSAGNAASGPAPEVKQETAGRDPLPDGTILPDEVPVVPRHRPSGLSPEEAKRLQRQAESQIPAKSAEHSLENEPSELNVSRNQDVFHRPSPNSPPVLSALPRVKLPKVTGNVQEGSPNVSDDGKTNPDVFYSPVRSADGKRTVSEEAELPEEVMQNIFHSPRVKRILSRKAPLSLQPNTRRPFEPVSVAADRAPSSAEESNVTLSEEKEKEDMEKLGSSLAEETKAANQDHGEVKSVPYQMVESRVPSSRLGRLWQYGGLATSIAFGAVGEGLRRITGSGENSTGSIVFSPANVERLVAKLSRMRGAALKLGQMLSFQDSKMLPDSIQQILQRVQDRADYMPASQRDKVLTQNLGPNWRDLFESFDEIPMAAASIGQVHAATLKKNGQPVAVKVQYPGVAESIDSDLNNLSILLTASRLLPKGLYLDKTIANARVELAWECDYVREAESANRFRQLLQDDDVFVVPEIIAEASGKQVLTMERMYGVPVTRIQNFTQEQRDWIGTQILRLCFREICEFRYMQTDPNWTNFLYNSQTNKIELLDFGASRDYPADFINLYVRTLAAASRNDRDACRELSLKLGYLTGYETQTMVDAHVTSMLTLAEPYMASSPDVYDFSNQTITDRVRALIPLMLRERLTPPPEETYSLHRKLSGAFLLCAKLGSRVRCKELFANAIERAKATGIDVD